MNELDLTGIDSPADLLWFWTWRRRVVSFKQRLHRLRRRGIWPVPVYGDLAKAEWLLLVG
jgi:hypothetical protein